MVIDFMFHMHFAHICLLEHLLVLFLIFFSLLSRSFLLGFELLLAILFLLLDEVHLMVCLRLESSLFLL